MLHHQTKKNGLININNLLLCVSISEKYFYQQSKMDKFRIKKVVSKSSNEPNEPVDNNPVDILNNNDEFKSLTREDHLLYNHIHSLVSNSETNHLNDKLPITDQLLYLLFDLRGCDGFLDYIMDNPMDVYLNKTRAKLEINDDTKEIVRKCLHYSAYHHMLTYDYNKLKNTAIQLANQQQQKHQKIDKN